MVAASGVAGHIRRCGGGGYAVFHSEDVSVKIPEALLMII